MDAHRIRRFARHLSLPEVGYAGQEAIGRACVVLFAEAPESRLAFETAREYLLAAGVVSVESMDPDHPGTVATVAMGDSGQVESWAKKYGIPLVSLVYSEKSVRIVSTSERAPRELVLPGPILPSGNIAIGGLVAAEILWQIVGGSHPT
ncbi:MAG: hypothetical protein SGI86_10695 [Deltaproteobacteria bacterium]|nr:hypothetical protein [Deltaproteobacteria bacterium]